MVFCHEAQSSSGVNPRWRSFASRNNVSSGHTLIDVEKHSVGASDDFMSQLVRELPLEDLEYLELGSEIAKICFNADGVQCAELFAARAVRHLGLRLGDIATLLPLLNSLGEAHIEKGRTTATIFPNLETLVLHSLQPVVAEVEQVGAAVAAIVRGRQDCATPLRRIFISERLKGLGNWEALLPIPEVTLTFFAYGDFDVYLPVLDFYLDADWGEV